MLRFSQGDLYFNQVTFSPEEEKVVIINMQEKQEQESESEPEL